jgi:hypothetical protein
MTGPERQRRASCSRRGRSGLVGEMFESPIERQWLTQKTNNGEHSPPLSSPTLVVRIKVSSDLPLSLP